MATTATLPLFLLPPLLPPADAGGPPAPCISVFTCGVWLLASYGGRKRRQGRQVERAVQTNGAKCLRSQHARAAVVHVILGYQDHR